MKKVKFFIYFRADSFEMETKKIWSGGWINKNDKITIVAKTEIREIKKNIKSKVKEKITSKTFPIKKSSKIKTQR